MTTTRLDTAAGTALVAAMHAAAADARAAELAARAALDEVLRLAASVPLERCRRVRERPGQPLGDHLAGAGGAVDAAIESGEATLMRLWA